MVIVTESDLRDNHNLNRFYAINTTIIDISTIIESNWDHVKESHIGKIS